MTELSYPVEENNFSVTIVHNDDSDQDDVLLLYSENKVSIFMGVVTQYEAGIIEFIGTFTKGTDLINKFVNGEMRVFDFIEKIELLNKRN